VLLVDRPDVAELEAELSRLAGRLRSLSDVRLGRPFPPHESRASAALDLAQLLADAAQGVEERASLEPPERRIVPDLGVFALGDQVAVTGRDLVAATRAADPDAEVWSTGRRLPAQSALAAMTESVRALRLAV
jgi:hypothetical protein